ncbi:MAG: alpha-E domain-containing protein [Chitinophagaceae bacterium]
MLSRIADSLFWLNRYMERTDSLLRVIRTNYILSFDIGNSSGYSWKDILASFTNMDAETIKLNGENASLALEYLIASPKNINALKVLIVRARENARGGQDHITKEVWEQVNQLYHLINQPDLAKKLKGSKAIEILDMLAQNSVLFYGVTDSTMPRGQGWNFMNLGKFIERCLLTIEITDAHFRKTDYKLDKEQDILYWRNLLLSLSGYELYLKTYTNSFHNMNILDHVIVNKNFPRSIFYSLERIKRYLDHVTRDTQIEGSNDLLKMFGRLHSKIQYIDLTEMNSEKIPAFLNSTRHDLVEFSQQLSRVYFSYA